MSTRLLRILGLGLALLVLSTSTVMAQTAEQSDTRMQALMDSQWSIGCRSGCKGTKSSALASKADALALRQACVSAGATAEQLSRGDAHVGSGNGYMAWGAPYEVDADSDHTSGQATLSSANLVWASGNFASACVLYEDSIDDHAGAISNYGFATSRYSQAGTNYSDAWVEWNMLLLELTF